jgi:N-acyl-D-amino-acid deacylase
LDSNAKEAVSPTSLFRIASVSKPITAVAILKLVQQEILSLDDTIVSFLELRKPKDPRWKSVTVRHLLHHTGGWDSKASYDPIFHFRTITKDKQLSFPLSHQDLIEYMLDQSLDFEPGSKYAYSNFGYCLLGRIIEKATKTSYEKYVQEAIFQPLGITRPRIGKTLSEDRFPTEVEYHDASDRKGTPVVATEESLVPWPYGAWDLGAMDSHGGWVASSTDLVRFACEFDPAKKKRALDSDLIQEMFSPPLENVEGHSPNVSYGYGWQVRTIDAKRKNVWHTGRLDGTAALLVRRHDGFHWAVLFNKAVNLTGTYLIDIVDPLMHKIVDSVKRWPSTDLFSDYFPKKPQ